MDGPGRGKEIFGELHGIGSNEARTIVTRQNGEPGTSAEAAGEDKDVTRPADLLDDHGAVLSTALLLP
jgi:hypothetical protein